MSDFRRLDWREREALSPEERAEYERREELHDLEVAVGSIRPLALAIRPLEEASHGPSGDGIHMVPREGSVVMLTAAGADLVLACLPLAVEDWRRS